MSYTPVELRHVRVARRLFGYHRASVEQILADVADSFETVWRDRGELADKVEQIELQLREAKGREQVLTNTLVAAEHAAEELRQRAKREAELILSEAHAEARSVLRSSQGQLERLAGETRRIEALLRSALGLVDEVGEPVAEVEAAAPEPIAAVEPPVEETARPERAPAPAAFSPPPVELEPEVHPEPEPEAKHEETPEFHAVTELAAPEAHDENDDAGDDPFAVSEAEEQPGWPPLEKVARGGSNFDWGD